MLSRPRRKCISD